MNTGSEHGPPHRVAIYYAPATDSAWWHSGSEWLGRCARSGLLLAQPVLSAMDPGLFARLTADPRRYGWHATLKAPFRLATGQTMDSLLDAVCRICAGREPFELPPLQVGRMNGFLALRPIHELAALDELAADCVQQLQPLAQPLSPDELERRRRADLTAEQDALLQAWGYPYVLQQFRFHLSLTGPLQALPAEALAALLESAASRFHALPNPQVDRLSVFVEPHPGADFRLLEQVVFAP